MAGICWFVVGRGDPIGSSPVSLVAVRAGWQLAAGRDADSVAAAQAVKVDQPDVVVADGAHQVALASLVAVSIVEPSTLRRDSKNAVKRL